MLHDHPCHVIRSIVIFGLISISALTQVRAQSSFQKDLAGVLGLQVEGVLANGLLGKAISATGDLNGDGQVDLVLGAPNVPVLQDGSTLTVAGEVVVMFGPLGPQAPDIDSLRSANGGDGSRGFIIQAENAGDRVGEALAVVGDVNGDGRDDLLIGAPGVVRSPVGTPDGGAYLVFGQPAFPPELDLRTLRPDVDNLNTGHGVIFLSGQIASSAGTAVAGVGDVNVDGLPDLLIGNRRPIGGGFVSPRIAQSFLVYGRPASRPWPAVFDLFEVDIDGSGDEAIILLGEDLASLGRSVTGLGDFNGDGIDDFAMGAPTFGDGSEGKVIIVPGRASSPGPGFGGGLDFTPAAARESTFQLLSAQPDELLGDDVVGLGDINGDGRPDLAAGSERTPRFGNESGAVFVVFGRSAEQPLNREYPVENLLPANGGNGSDGFVVSGREGDHLGASVAGLGDLNGDGLNELLIGIPELLVNGSDLGGIAVVYGRPADAPHPPLIQIQDLIDGDGSLGFVLTGAEQQGRAGRSVAAAGDLNGDGSSDFLVGAELEDGQASNSGRVYVLQGSGQDAPGGFQAEQTGAYLDLAQAGQGVLIEIGTLGSDPALFAAWYTYADGEQLWFAAGPERFSPGSRSVTATLLRTRGARFGEAFDPSEVINETWGTVQIQLAACDAIQWTYESFDGAESGELSLVPLLAEVLALPGCRSASARPFSPVSQALAGTWWNPARAGEGIVIDIDVRGGQPTAFLTWFTYDQARQLWLVGSVGLDRAVSELTGIPLIETRGASFGSDFDPADVVVEDWGSVTFTYAGCNQAVLTYRRNVDGGEETGSIDLVRFTDGLFGAPCLD